MHSTGCHLQGNCKRSCKAHTVLLCDRYDGKFAQQRSKALSSAAQCSAACPVWATVATGLASRVCSLASSGSKEKSRSEMVCSFAGCWCRHDRAANAGRLASTATSPTAELEAHVRSHTAAHPAHASRTRAHPGPASACARVLRLSFFLESTSCQLKTAQLHLFTSWKQGFKNWLPRVLLSPRDTTRVRVDPLAQTMS